jgi:hypothetical protein
MGLTVFEVLDEAIEAGGANLAGKDIAAKGKSADSTLLNDMCSSGLLEKTTKGSKYTVTIKGREAWEKEATEDRVRQIREEDQWRQRQALVQFLACVAKKQEKALTKTEAGHFPDSLRQQASDQKLVEPGTTKGSYRLLSVGKNMLRTFPAEEQLKQLRQQHQQTVALWQARQQWLSQELAEMGSRGLQVAVDQVAVRSRTAFQTFEAILTELGGIHSLLIAGQQVRAEFQAEKARIENLETRLRQEAQQHSEQLEALDRRVAERLDDLARRMEADRATVVEKPLPHEIGLAEATVWEFTRRAHEHLRQETIRIGGIVKVPELTDAVSRDVPGLTPAAFHDLLRKWQQEDKLTLQLCNDPRLEPRANAGIQSPRGLLFYVQMR